MNIERALFKMGFQKSPQLKITSHREYTPKYRSYVRLEPLDRLNDSHLINKRIKTFIYSIRDKDLVIECRFNNRIKILLMDKDLGEVSCLSEDVEKRDQFIIVESQNQLISFFPISFKREFLINKMIM